MTTDEAIAVFSSYSSAEKKEFLAHLMHELTIVARDSYEVGGNDLINSSRVRRLNEVQHRVSGFLLALRRNDAQRYPDDILVKIILEQPDDDILGRQLSEAFARLTTQRLTAA